MSFRRHILFCRGLSSLDNADTLIYVPIQLRKFSPSFTTSGIRDVFPSPFYFQLEHTQIVMTYACIPDFPKLMPSLYPIFCINAKPLLPEEMGKDRPFSLASLSMTFIFLALVCCGAYGLSIVMGAILSITQTLAFLLASLFSKPGLTSFSSSRKASDM